MTDSDKAGSSLKALTIIETVLRDRTAFFMEIWDDVSVGHKVKSIWSRFW